MKFPRPFPVSLLLFLSFFNVRLMNDAPDLTGIWEGRIYLSDIDIDLEITLTLTEELGILAGHIADDWGYLDCDIMEPLRKDDLLTFKALVETSRDEHQMAFRMIVAGGKMTGQWESLGTFGDWSLTRKEEGENRNRKLFDQEDILGIWKGPAAYKSNPGSKNILTLKLEEREGRLMGTFSDQFGTDYKQVNIKSFRDNKIVLEVPFLWRNDTYVMDIDVAIKDDFHIRGKFKIDKMARSGIWTAEKQTVK